MKKLIKILNKKNWTLSCCESVTGGLLSNLLTNNQGASKWFTGSLVAYSTDSKINVCDIDSEAIDSYGTVSTEIAKTMVINCADKFNTNLAISTTGIAGPDAIENKPIGLVYIGLFVNNNIKILELKSNETKRSAIKEQVSLYAIKHLIIFIKEQS